MLICPPLGKEHNHTARGFKRLAEKLAAERIAALRFHYAGTGESAGSQTAAEAVEHWDNSITRCINHLRELGFLSPAVVAHRSGALLAANNSSVSDHASALVLWDPIVRGRVFVRSQQMLYASIAEGPEDAAEPKHLTRLAGITMHKQASQTLSRMTIAPEALVAAHASDVAALVRTDERDSPLATNLADAGCTVMAIGDQAPFIDAADPWFTSYPEELSTIVHWLSSRFPSTTRAITPAVTSSAVMGHAADGRPIETRITNTADGLMLWDTAILGTHDTADRVVLSHPIGHDISSGPSRFYTELALDVAERGGRMLRFDRRGVGESGTTDPDDTFAGLFTTSYARDDLAILHHLDLSHARVVAHIGVCVGSWAATHAAINTVRHSPHTRSVAVMVNPNRWDIRPSSPIRPLPGVTASVRARVERQKQRLIARTGRDLIGFSSRVRPQRLRNLLSRVRVFQMPDAFIDTAHRRGVEIRLVFGPRDHDLFTRLGAPNHLARRQIDVPVEHTLTGDHSAYHTRIREVARASCLAALGLSDVPALTADIDQPVHSPVR